MLSEEDQEHVTKYFYRNPDSFKILSVVTDDLSIRKARFVVDTPEDLLSIEDTLVRQPNVGKGYAELARLENDCND
jgi:spore coat polysaccharide biosynthesis protein SpsF (cytidylyltransferase family)